MAGKRTTYKYMLKKRRYWNHRLWKPETDSGPITIDIERDGIPPYHFVPIDGGPIMVNEKDKDGKVRAVEKWPSKDEVEIPRVPEKTQDEPTTLGAFRQSQVGGAPIGAPPTQGKARNANQKGRRGKSE